MEEETQDSQAYLEALKADLRNSTYIINNDLSENHEEIRKRSALHSEDYMSTDMGEARPCWEAPQTILHPGIDPGLSTIGVAACTACVNTSDPSPQLPCEAATPNVASLASQNEASPPSSSRRAKQGVNEKTQPLSTGETVRKMDGSQQTPTQVNEDRDYHVCVSNPGSLNDAHTQQASNEEEEYTLLEDDTGAVKFDVHTQFPRPSSQVSEDAGFESTKGHWHAATPTKGVFAAGTSIMAPETPALPQNPFACSNFGISAPLAGSELFGQTQSSAVKKYSPGSSRPSPNMIAKSLSLTTTEISPLKYRTNVSSPTDVRSSSPSRLHELPAVVSRAPNLSMIEEEETLSRSHSPKDGIIIPESPTGRPSRRIGSRLQEHYESMKESQGKKMRDDLMQVNETDSESDNAPTRRMDRKKRAEKRRAQGARQMERATYNAPATRRSTDDPPQKRRRISAKERMLDTSKVAAPPSTVVIDSQDKAVPSKICDELESTQDTTNNNAIPLESTKNKLNECPVEQQAQAFEAIPATSPTQSSLQNSASLQIPDTAPDPELPALWRQHRKSKSPDPAASLALTSGLRVSKTYNRRTSRLMKTAKVITSSSSELPAEESDVDVEEPPSPSTSPTSPLDNEQASSTKTNAEERNLVEESPTPLPRVSKKLAATSAKAGTPSRNTRSKTKPKNVKAPVTRKPAAERTRSESSSLSPAPTEHSSSPIPIALEKSRRSSRRNTMPASTETPARSLRRRALRKGTSSVSPRLASRRTKRMKRPPISDSQSADELRQASPSVSVLEKSMIQTKAIRSFRQSMGPSHRGRGLFENMVFAISFQSDMLDRTSLEAKIRDAGGLVLTQGFEELFEKSMVMGTSAPVFDDAAGPQLTEFAEDFGFTALLADGHSRKAKYMQALALGLPCLAHQWITACLEKDVIVDWEPYLLCAGSSAVLGSALRSRSLPSYSAETASLAEMVAQRRKLLEGQRIMVVVDSKKGRNEAKQPYMFLAQALGPTMSRVFSTSQAQKVLLDSAQANEPYDWVYVDQGTGSVEAVLSGYDVGKRRKKLPWVSSLLKRVRVLNDELVIQSLILGRMVEEGELHE